MFPQPTSEERWWLDTVPEPAGDCLQWEAGSSKYPDAFPLLSFFCCCLCVLTWFGFLDASEMKRNSYGTNLTSGENTEMDFQSDPYNTWVWGYLFILSHSHGAAVLQRGLLL